MKYVTLTALCLVTTPKEMQMKVKKWVGCVLVVAGAETQDEGTRSGPLMSNKNRSLRGKRNGRK